ncbi:hypothetical protein [Arcobacter roscoffensis]|uniref:Uncharacterized protein n=1 Tax=Arcobacter roscoffensis TaxID=2961520 RepID=A0ABY5E8Q7_9BACT|nr:hypothetical protein [Arcobacter roscoffensis]UTJ07115.1 hypothetical protein NJU99_03180 [Arcobacter roscoffensis]
MNIYNKEIKELEIKVLEKVKNKLLLIVESKIRSNSKAFIELKNLINNISSEIFLLKQDADGESLKENSIVKINTSTLNQLFSLKVKLQINTIAELLDLLVNNYDELFLIDSLIKIKPYSLDRNKAKDLNETDFYICTQENDLNSHSINNTTKILYKLDDLVIYDNKEYLDLNAFKTYTFDNETFNISPMYTLQDIDLFIFIWNKKLI